MGLSVESKSRMVPVRPGDLLELTIAIGNAQGGGWAFRYGTITRKGEGSTKEPIPLGTGEDAIKRDSIHVNTTTFDIRPETDQLAATVTVRRSSDGMTFSIPHVKTIEPGGSALFVSVFGFFAEAE